jgi:hypothetical protein
MTHQQYQHLVDVRLVTKNQRKILILMTNAQPVNHVVHVMIAETVRPVENSLLTNPQNQLSMSVPTVNR